MSHRREQRGPSVPRYKNYTNALHIEGKQSVCRCFREGRIPSVGRGVATRPRGRRQRGILGRVQRLRGQGGVLRGGRQGRRHEIHAHHLVRHKTILRKVFPLTPSLSNTRIGAFLVTLSRLPKTTRLATGLPGSKSAPWIPYLRKHACAPLPISYTLPKTITCFIHSKTLRSPGPLYTLHDRAPTLHLSNSARPIVPSLGKNIPREFLSCPHRCCRTRHEPFYHYHDYLPRQGRTSG